jgi:hypothetical protein
MAQATELRVRYLYCIDGLLTLTTIRAGRLRLSRDSLPPMTLLLVSILLSVLLVAILIAQCYSARCFLADFQRVRREHAAVTSWPRAAVVMAVRGGTEAVRDSLQRFTDAGYPNFEIHVVADSLADSTIPIIEPWAASRCSVQCHSHVLAEISPHASLKCSAVRQCLLALDETVEVAAVVDADSRAYPGWLCDLVSTMLAKKAGLVSGNRWYAPQASGWGSLVRYIYNAHAVVPMHLATMPWGGSLAIHRRVFAMEQFGEILWHAPTEDAAVRDLMRVSGQACLMHPRVMLMNDDSISLVDCFRFIRRQLLWTRLYHPVWAIALSAILVTYGVLAAQSLGAVYAVWQGDVVAAACCAGGPVLALSVSLGLMLVMHRTILSGVIIPENTQMSTLTLRDTARLVAALPIALATIALAACGAACARSVEWSGIRYAITKAGRLKLLSYEPLRAATVSKQKHPARSTARR